MHLEVDGEKLSSALSEQSVLEVLKEAAGRTQSSVQVVRGVEDFLSVSLGTDHPTALMKVWPGEPGAEGDRVIVVPDPSPSLEFLAELFVCYAAEDPRWDGMVDWSQSVQERAEAEAMAKGRILVRKLAKGTVALVVTLLAAAVVFGDLPLIGAVNFLFVFFGLSVWWLWVRYALGTIRPVIAKRLGASQGVVIYRGGSIGFGTSGQWDIQGEAPLWFRVALPFVDITLLLTLTMVPFAVVVTLLIYVVNGFSF